MPSYNADGQACYELELNNGYYYMYINANLHGAIDGLYNLTIFATHKTDYHSNHTLKEGTEFRTPVNTNENATFRMVAVTVNNLQPTVIFHGTDGEAIATYQHKYTDINRKHNYSPNPSSCIEGVLLTPAEVFALAQAADETIVTPTKDSGIAEVEYVIDGWCDAEGNLVDAVYMNGDLYPHFKVVDKRTQYNVEFQNYDGSVLYTAVVPEDVTPDYFGATPKIPYTDSNSFEFIGWDPELAPMPVTPEADGATAAEKVVYTAKYKEIERRYDVSYYDEDGETLLDEDLYIKSGEASSTEVVPTKDADVQYNYTFDK
ncbi:MAG: hypothetical protein IJ519_02175, partial [Clostridia bacterium]|nr:hypothetical protein [Clostridia bacterium]